MKWLSHTRRTRFFATLLGLVLITACCIAAICKDMESLAITCVPSAITLLNVYIYAQTKRPSKNN